MLLDVLILQDSKKIKVIHNEKCYVFVERFIGHKDLIEKYGMSLNDINLPSLFIASIAEAFPKTFNQINEVNQRRLNENEAMLNVRAINHLLMCSIEENEIKESLGRRKLTEHLESKNKEKCRKARVKANLEQKRVKVVDETETLVENRVNRYAPVMITLGKKYFRC